MCEKGASALVVFAASAHLRITGRGIRPLRSPNWEEPDKQGLVRKLYTQRTQSYPPEDSQVDTLSVSLPFRDERVRGESFGQHALQTGDSSRAKPPKLACEEDKGGGGSGSATVE